MLYRIVNLSEIEEDELPNELHLLNLDYIPIIKGLLKYSDIWTNPDADVPFKIDQEVWQVKASNSKYAYIVYDNIDVTKIMAWIKDADFYIIRDFLTKTFAFNNFQFVYILGTQAPILKWAGLFSENNVDGYQLWIKSK